MKSSIHAPALRNIHITDPLFSHYTALVADRILPYQWEVLNDRVPDAEKSHCIENFCIAAGRSGGERQGVIFCDTDAYKWLEAVAYCIESGNGKRFISMADQLIELICAAQEPDGYLNTYYSVVHPEQRWTNLAEGHELYCAGHLIEAAVAYHNATGKDELLSSAMRLADLIGDVFGTDKGKCHGYPGHQEIELALVKLYRTTGKESYLALAEYFIRQRGKRPNYLMNEMSARKELIFQDFSDYDEMYAQTQTEPVNQTEAVGHAVRALYMYSGMADVALETADEPLREACKTLWNNLTKRRMYITGGVGSSGHLERFTTDYDLPNDQMYCESCASVALMMFGQRMAALTREASYYDVVERALCNTVLAGISADGDRYFYVNPLEVWPANCLPSTSLAHVKPVRQSWFACACCPTNIARTLASLGQYIYAVDDRSIYINQFISSSVCVNIQQADVLVRLDSSYLVDGTVRITVETPAPRPFTIRVRVPSFYTNPEFLLSGKTIKPVIENGYAVLAVSRPGVQVFEIHGGVRPRWTAANLQVRADAGRLALSFGPFVYCLEQTDNGEALANLFAIPEEVTEERPALGLVGTLPVLSFRAKRLIGSIAETDALYGRPQFAFSEQRVKAIPYCLWCNRTPGEMLVWMHTTI